MCSAISVTSSTVSAVISKDGSSIQRVSWLQEKNTRILGVEQRGGPPACLRRL
uniref:Uncharacterized protein n=1 Tax=Oryza barthii TaxID=65489 RepID=A0A0D3F742_9ORYZ